MSNDTTPRTLFSKPIRASTTAAMFPCPLTLDQFLSEMRHSLNGFEENMRMAKPGDDPHGWLQPKYVEQWVEMWLGWSDIEVER